MTKQEHRKHQANAIRIRASALRMPIEEFTTHFRLRHVVASMDERDAVENATGEMFCNECFDTGMHGSLEANILHSTISDDPLRNFWKLCYVRCYRCGFNEVIPLDAPVFAEEELREFMPTLVAPTSPLLEYHGPANPWRDEAVKQMRQREVEQARTTAQMQLAAHRQQAQAMQNMSATEARIRAAMAQAEMAEKMQAKMPPPPPMTEYDSLFKRIGDKLGL